MTGGIVWGWYSCGCTVWQILLFRFGEMYPVGRCGRCGEAPKTEVCGPQFTRTEAYAIAREAGLLNPDAPVHPVEQLDKENHAS